jgi:hypothetical protein
MDETFIDFDIDGFFEVIEFPDDKLTTFKTYIFNFINSILNFFLLILF